MTDKRRHAFERNVLPHLDAAHNLARWLMGNPQDAEGVVQEAYLRAFRSFVDWRGGDARTWLMRIVRNTCYGWLRINRPLQNGPEFDDQVAAPGSQAPDLEEIALQNASGSLMRKALEKLSPNSREVLILRELEGMSYREIAEITGMPAGAVMPSLARARERLRQALTGLTSVQRQVLSERNDTPGGSA
jgi:RNA polymerase sigma-70 factor (ECF subfamily)